MYICIHIHMYIYIERERERKRQRKREKERESMRERYGKQEISKVHKYRLTLIHTYTY